GKLVAVGSDFALPSVWNAESGKLITNLEWPELPKERHFGNKRYSSPQSFEFLRGSRSVVTAGPDNEARIFDAKSGQLRLRLQRHQGIIDSVVYEPSRGWIATAARDMKVMVWEEKTGAWQAGSSTLNRGHEHQRLIRR